jgi:hypothetical protein
MTTLLSVRGRQRQRRVRDSLRTFMIHDGQSYNLDAYGKYDYVIRRRFCAAVSQVFSLHQRTTRMVTTTATTRTREYDGGSDGMTTAGVRTTSTALIVTIVHPRLFLLVPVRHNKASTAHSILLASNRLVFQHASEHINRRLLSPLFRRSLQRS